MRFFKTARVFHMVTVFNYCCVLVLVNASSIAHKNEQHDNSPDNDSHAIEHDSHGNTHDEDHDHDLHTNNHQSKDVFDLLHNELDAKYESLLTVHELTEFYDRLHLKSCFRTKEISGRLESCNTCFNISHILSWHNITTTAQINEALFYQLTPTILFVLTTTIPRSVGPNHCSNTNQSTTDTEMKDTFKIFQNEFGNYGDSEEETEESIESLLVKVNESIADKINNSQKCYTAHDILRDSDIHHALRNQDQLEVVSSHILYQVFRGSCFRGESHDEHGGGKHRHRHGEELPKASSFVVGLLHSYSGEDMENNKSSSMTSQDFKQLYKGLKLGVLSSEKDGDDGHDHEKHKRRRKRREIVSVAVESDTELDKCFDADDILDIFSITTSTPIDANKFEKMCPALIYQMDKKTCIAKEPIKEAKTKNTWKAWAGMFVAISVVSLGSLSGIVAAPISKKKWFPYLIMCLIALAVATLIGDAILHLFPHAMKLHEHKDGESHGNPLLDMDSYLWKSICFLLGLYVFFMFEMLMHAFGGEHSHSHGVEKHITSSSTNNSAGVKGTLGMTEEGAVMYNNRIKSNSILRPSGLHECPATKNDCNSDTCPEEENKSTCSSAHENLSETDTIPPCSPGSSEISIKTAESQQILVIDEKIEEHKSCQQNPCEQNEEEDEKLNEYHLNTAFQDETSLENHHSHSHGNHHHGHSHQGNSLAASLSKLKSVAWMVLVGDAIHNFLDGIAIGVAFSETWPEGLHGGISTSIAILCHELPHELGDFAVLLNSGLSIKQALVMNFISSFTAFIGGIIGVSLGTQWEASNYIFAMTAGLFVYIALVDMLPEILHSSTLKQRPWFCMILTNLGLLIGFGIMIVLGAWEEDIKTVLKN